MKRPVLAALMLACVLALEACGGTTQTSPTPIQVVNRFGWEVSHGNLWDACAETTSRPRIACAGFFMQALTLAGDPHFRAVPSSEKTWQQTYHGRRVELATVAMTATGLGPNARFTAHLVKTEHGWRLTSITAAN